MTAITNTLRYGFELIKSFRTRPIPESPSLGSTADRAAHIQDLQVCYQRYTAALTADPEAVAIALMELECSLWDAAQTHGLLDYPERLLAFVKDKAGAPDDPSSEVHDGDDQPT